MLQLPKTALWLLYCRHFWDASSWLSCCFGCSVGTIWCMTRLYKLKSLSFTQYTSLKKVLRQARVASIESFLSKDRKIYIIQTLLNTYKPKLISKLRRFLKTVPCLIGIHRNTTMAKQRYAVKQKWKSFPQNRLNTNKVKDSIPDTFLNNESSCRSASNNSS